MKDEQPESVDDSVSIGDESTEEVKNEEKAELVEPDAEKPVQTAAPAVKTSRIKKAWATYKSRKKLFVPLTVLALLLLLMAIPSTRYGLLGTVVKRNLQIKFTDMQTSLPISGVEVSARGRTAKTDAQGNATLQDVKLGNTNLVAHKKYYKDISVQLTVTLAKVKGSQEIKLEATGRQVPITVRNKLTGKGVSGAVIKAADTETETDEEGKTVVVLPPDKASVDAVISTPGYNDLKTTIQVNDQQVKENDFRITPAGKIYFLSKLSGKIDVVRADLDGTNRQTVLAGTGREIEYNTVLLASRDWKYLALQARREGDKEKLYLIDTQNDNKLTTMDEGDASFTPVGWYNEHFVFQVNRNREVWQDKRSALKSFNASSGQLATIDETAGQGSNQYDAVYESYGSVYILDNLLVYPKNWSTHYAFPYRLDGKQHTIFSVRPDGSDKKTLKSFAVRTDGQYSAIEARLYEPQEVYFQIQGTSPLAFFEYEDGAIKEAKDATSETFNRFYPTYLVSPSGKQTFWFEERDGKNVLFLGNNNGEDQKQIASLSEFTPYGWFSDDYLLVSKKGSELYIVPAGNVTDPNNVLKVTDYHKPSRSFSGYGYGYGGF